MKQKYLVLSLVLFLVQLGFSQSTSNLRGQIVTEDGTPVPNVNIKVVGTTAGTNSNLDGRFLLQGIMAGNRVIRFTYVGFEPKEVEVFLPANETVSLPTVVLQDDEQELDEVIISATWNINEFTRPKSDFVAKLPLKDIENPQVYNTITAELLEQQIVTNFDDALKNASGISKLWESTGRGNDGAGYFSLRGFAVQPTLVNGLPGLTNASPDPANIERIEVIKGPSGTLYGSSLISYGGLINIVTKKPYDYFGGNISYTMGSFGLNRITADVNMPLDEEGDIAMRINTAYHTENSFQDAGFHKSLFVAPSFSYKVNDRLSFYVNTEFYDSESTNPTMLFVDRGAQLRVNNIEELGYDPERSYTSNDLTIENPTFSLQGQMLYKLSDEWTSQTVISRGSAKSLGHYSYLYETTRFYQGMEEVEGSVTNLDEGIVLTRYINDQNSTTLTTDIQQNFVGDFEILGMRNRMVAGLDYFNRQVIDNSSGYVANGNIYIGDATLQNVNESVFGIYDPAAYITDNDSGVLSAAGTNALLANSNRNNNTTEENIYSAYVSDVLNFTPYLSLMASLRVDHFENEDNSQTALSPKFGLVYQPIDDKISIFANYMDGFTNVAPQEEGDPTAGATTTVTFDPERARQLEVGTKLSLLDNRIAATFSYYDIQVFNIVMEETGRPFYYVQDGERYSRGFEANFVANPFKGFNIIAGYSHNESELTVSDQTDFLGRRPESAGPVDMANLWASYAFTSGNLRGFGFGFGGNYASENMIFNRQLGGVFTLPSYTVLNAGVFYNVQEYSINVKLNNLGNEEYYNGWSTINPQTPRNVMASFTYKF